MRALVLLVALAWLGLQPSAGARAQQVGQHAIQIPPWFVETFLDFREDAATAAKARKRLLVYFGQDGCPYCKLLMETTFAETRIADKARRHLLPVALNLWGDREVNWVDGRRMTEKELGKLLKVQFTPTLLMFDEKPEPIVRLNGYFPADRLEAAIDYVAGRMERKQPFADYLLAAKPTPANAKLNEHPVFLKPPLDLAAARAAGKPLAVLFERAGCASCDELHRDGLGRADVRALLDRFTVARVDLGPGGELVTPAGRRIGARAWARQLAVPYAPGWVFFDTAGKEVFRLEGYVRPFHLSSVLDYVASGAYRTEPSLQRFIQARAERLRERGQTVDLWR